MRMSMDMDMDVEQKRERHNTLTAIGVSQRKDTITRKGRDSGTERTSQQTLADKTILRYRQWYQYRKTEV
jgi:hypothetical protein